MAADRAEPRIRSERRLALRAGDDRRRCADRPPAVRAEVRAPDERRSARAARRWSGAPRRNRRGEERVEFLQPVVESEELVTAIDEEVLAELVSPEHLEHQPAEVAQALLAGAHQRAALATETPGVGQGPTRGPGRSSHGHSGLFAAKTCKQRWPRHCDQCNSGL